MDKPEHVELIKILGKEIIIEMSQNDDGEWSAGALVLGERLAMPVETFKNRENARQYALGIAKAKIVGGIWRR